MDGTSLAYRSFFAFIRNPLRNSKGKNTSAVFGFINALLKLLNEKKPEYMLICFDPHGPTLRHKEFEEYKAGRPETPAELSSQFSMIKKVVEAFGIQTCEMEGIEADDVIGTVAKLASSEGFEVIIYADDKDFLQLESRQIKIFSPKTFEFTHSETKLNIPAELVPDFLGLTGDAIDNIPGVKGIGPKNATQLINEFGKIENIYENIAKVKSEKIKAALIEYKESALFSKQLATIKTEIPLEITPETLKVKAPDEPELFSLLKELEFFSILKKLIPAGGEQKEYKLADLTLKKLLLRGNK